MYQHGAAVAIVPCVPFNKSVAANAATEDDGIKPSAEMLPELSGGGDVLVYITDNGWKSRHVIPVKVSGIEFGMRSVAFSFDSTIKVIWLINQVKINMAYAIYLREKR